MIAIPKELRQAVQESKDEFDPRRDSESLTR
jgi:hypothetical protein